MISKILIVDDSEADQFLCKHAVHGFDSKLEIHEAHDGQQALDFLSVEGNVIDLILLDINMPGLGGFGFLERHKNESINPETPVIILTSSNHDKDFSQASSYECVKGYLEKPLQKQSIEDVITRLNNAP